MSSPLNEWAGRWPKQCMMLSMLRQCLLARRSVSLSEEGPAKTLELLC
jgi:hypothetical protein